MGSETQRKSWRINSCPEQGWEQLGGPSWQKLRGCSQAAIPLGFHVTHLRICTGGREKLIGPSQVLCPTQGRDEWTTWLTVSPKRKEGSSVQTKLVRCYNRKGGCMQVGKNTHLLQSWSKYPSIQGWHNREGFKEVTFKMSLEDGINVMRRKPNLGNVWMQE